MANVNSPRTQRSTVKSRHTDRTNPKRSTTPRQTAMVSVIAATPVVTVTSHSNNHEHHDIHEAVDTPAGHNHEYPNTGGLQPCVTGACYPPSLTRCSPTTPRRLRVGRAAAQPQTRTATAGEYRLRGWADREKSPHPVSLIARIRRRGRFDSSKSALGHRHSEGADHHCGIRQIIRVTKDHHERTVVPSRLSSIRSA